MRLPCMSPPRPAPVPSSESAWTARKPPLPPTRLPKFTIGERRVYEEIMSGRDEMRWRVIGDEMDRRPFPMERIVSSD